MNEADQGAARVRELSHFIDGQRAAGASGRFCESTAKAQSAASACSRWAVRLGLLGLSAVTLDIGIFYYWFYPLPVQFPFTS
jgi:hypothetical protein